MKQEIKIPPMGESITEATIGAILKPGGTLVQENDELIELETEKVNQVLYAPVTGVISWTIHEGDSVKINEVIGSIDSEANSRPSPSKLEEKKRPPPPPSPSKKSVGSAERVMKESFVQELKQPSPLPAAAQKKTQAGSESVRKKMSKIRQTIASRLVESLHTAAMLTTFNEVDMSEINSLRSKYKESFVEKHGVKLGLMSFFVKAVVEALKTYPNFNSYIEGDEIVARQTYDIGIAVATDRGLVVPVLKESNVLSFPEIEKAIADYAQKARSSKITIADLEGGGFTITNGGIYGSLLSTPILNPPQVGILGMHKIMKRPIAIDDAVVIRPMMYLALSYDHRLIDGKEAVSFLVHIKEVLEDPSRLMFVDCV